LRALIVEISRGRLGEGCLVVDEEPARGSALEVPAATG